MSEQRLNRRSFLKLSAVTVLGAAMQACAQATPTPKPAAAPTKPAAAEPTKPAAAAATATPKPVTKFNEAPALAELVKAGKLPPVAERVSQEPLVIEPFQEVGQYGGSMNALAAAVNGTNFMSIAGYECMLRWDRQVKNIIPNVAKKWEVSPDGKAFTLYLRKGAKWSSGDPFTADDVLFYFEDVLGNKELTPAMPVHLVVGGQPVKAEKIDDYTVRLSFVKPHGFFLMYLAYYDRYWRPKNYMKQFHPKYAPAAELDGKVKAAKFETWMQLWGKMDDWYTRQSPDYPFIEAWIPTTPAPSTRYSFKRNPYYWKVDSQGNQLPYIDEVVVSIVENAQTVKLKTVAGSSDIQYVSIEFADYPLLKENADKSGFRVLLYDNPRGALPAFMPNQNTKDPVMRALIRDDRFRIALSYAINRAQVNEMVFLGAGVPRQATEASTSPVYKEEYGKAYAEYDPKKANALLDEMGLTKRDAEGYRQMSDGKTLFLLVETPGEDVATTSQVELLKKYWKEIGVKSELQNSERSIFRNRVYSGEVTMGTWLLDYVYYPYNPLFTVPLNNSCYWAPDFGNWYATGGKAGEEPTGDLRKLQTIWDQLVEVVEQPKQIELFRQIYDLHAKHCWMIGIVGEVPQPIVVNKKIRNIIDKSLYSWTHGQYIGPTQMEQYYFKQ